MSLPMSHLTQHHIIHWVMLYTLNVFANKPLNTASYYPLGDPRIFYLKYSFSVYTCLPKNSLISEQISTKFVSAFLLCMLYHTNNFQHKASSSMNLRGTFTVQQYWYECCELHSRGIAFQSQQSL